MEKGDRETLFLLNYQGEARWARIRYDADNCFSDEGFFVEKWKSLLTVSYPCVGLGKSNDVAETVETGK